MKLSNHAEGYFPVDRILLNIFNKDFSIVFMNISAFHLAKNQNQNFCCF